MAKEKKPSRIKSALRNWLDVPVGLTDVAFWAEWFGRSSSGKHVSVDSALQLSTVWACVRLLAETISTLPLRVYRRLPDGTRVSATDHPLHRVLCREPNSEMTPQRFMLMIVASLALRGNAFVEIKRLGADIVSLVPLLPQNMKVERLESGRLQYTYTEKGAQRVIPTKSIMHIRAFGLDGVSGMLPVTTGRDVIGAAMAADEAAAKIFAQGLQASGFLTVDSAGGAQGAGTLTDKQREQIRAALTKFSGSSNSGKTMVLEAGLKYQGITIDPEAAQMLETRAYGVEEICRWWRIPPFMVGHMDKQSSWASSVEAQNLHFLTNSLRPMLVNIEQEISRCLVGAAEYDEIFAEYAVEGLLRADSTGRSNYYNSALNNGWMSRNEVRRLENLPPIEGGDIYTVQSALVPIDQLGAVPGLSAKAAHFLMNLKAANDAGNASLINEAYAKAEKALASGDPDGPFMAHALLSLHRLNAA